MYVIDENTQIALKHVVRVGTNDRNHSIIFEMASGLNAVKVFDTQAEADTELTSVTTLIDGA